MKELTLAYNPMRVFFGLSPTLLYKLVPIQTTAKCVAMAVASQNRQTEAFSCHHSRDHHKHPR